MAFALTLFVEAASGRIAPAVESAEGSRVCRELYRMLREGAAAAGAPLPAGPRGEAARYGAFHTLYSHYDGDPLQAAVCARVLAFDLLMERGGGEAMAGWLQEDEGTEGLVNLHPALVEAMAAVRLGGSVMLSEAAFLRLAEEKAGGG